MRNILASTKEGRITQLEKTEKWR
ncbi:MAG: DUF2292 domain-containing protein [Candidatus Aenigmatarchaeota archaeon]